LILVKSGLQQLFLLMLSLTFGLVAWHSSNAFHLINKVILRQFGLVLGWVTACGQVTHLGM